MHSLIPDPIQANSEPFGGLLASVLRDRDAVTAVERFADWDDRMRGHRDLGAVDREPALAKHYSSLMPTSAPSADQQYAFEVDLDACSGCKACVVACHNLNGLEAEETWRKVGWLTTHDVNLPIVQHVTTACHHCVEPGCLKGCPVKAYEKDPLTGIVRHLDDQCIGCKYCTMMCPYEVPQYSTTLGIVRKCDMCSQRLSLGEAPACVQACPNEAIRITLVRTLDVRANCAATQAELLPTAPPSRITLPTTRFVTHRNKLTRRAVSLESLIDHPHEGHLPLVAMLVLTQASVGMWCVLSGLMILSDRPGQRWPMIAMVATIVGCVGVHLAMLHLGRPWLAFRAFLGWRTSWLSREAIVFGLYMGASVVAALAMAAWLDPNAIPSAEPLPRAWLDRIRHFPLVSAVFAILSTLRLPLAVSAAMIGLIAVACSAMIYVATQRTLWRLRRTGIEFAATTLGLGFASVAALDSDPSSRWMFLFGGLLAGIGLMAKFVDLQRSRAKALSQTGIEGHDFSGRSGRLLDGELAVVWKAAGYCWVVGLFLIAALCLRIVPLSMLSIVTGLSMSLLVASQSINRWLYFAAVVTYRMPGAST